jgi:hypothetical protein
MPGVPGALAVGARTPAFPAAFVAILVKIGVDVHAFAFVLALQVLAGDF